MRNFIVFIALLFTHYTFAQDISTYPGRATTEFLKLDVEGDHVIGIGACDGIWTSKNGGADWDIEYFGYLGQVSVDIFPDKPTQALIIIEGNLSLYDMDEGIVETYSSLGFNPQIREIVMSNDEVYLYTREALFVSGTEDIDWQQVVEIDTDTYGVGDKMDVTSDFVFYSTFDGTLFRYQKSNGNSVEVAKFDANIDQFSMGSNEHGVLNVSSTVKPIRTVDGWTTHTTLDEFSFGRNIQAHGDNLIMTALGRQYEVSNDGGETVTKMDLSNNYSMGDVKAGFIADDSSIYVYGSGAFLAKTINEGQDWTFANPYNRTDVQQLDINSSGIGYAGGSLGNLIQTEDHGITWMPYSVDVNNESEIVGIAVMENNDLVLAFVDELVVIREETVIHSEEIDIITLFRDVNDEYLICESFQDGEFKLLRSVDGGLTWTPILNLPAFAMEINQDENRNLYTVTSGGTSFHLSSDNGLTWDLLNIDFAANSFTARDGVYYAADFNSLHRSVDEGQTWDEILSFVFGVSSPRLGPDQALYATSGGNDQTNLHRSEDNGVTWENIWTFCTEPHQFILNNQNQLVIAHHDGHINVYPKPIMNSASEIVVKEESITIYPNPVRAGNDLYFEGVVEKCSLHSMEGKLIKRYGLSNGKVRLPSYTRAGAYIFKYQKEGALFHKMVMIH